MNGTPDWNRLFTEDAALRALPPERLDEAAARWPWYAGWSWLRARREQLEDGEVSEATLRQAAARTGERGRLKAWLDGHLELHLPAALHPAAPAVAPEAPSEGTAAVLAEPPAEPAGGPIADAEPEAAEPSPAEPDTAPAPETDPAPVEDPARLAAEARAAREAFERAEAEREASASAPEPEAAPAAAAPSVHPPAADPDARLSFSDWLRAMGSGSTAAAAPAPPPAGPPSPAGAAPRPADPPPPAPAPSPAMPQAPRFEATEDLQALDGLIARQRRRLAERMGQAAGASPEGAESASGERFAAGTGPLTQTWARILAEQGKTAEAIGVYRALALRHPEKSRYFAALIRELESR